MARATKRAFSTTDEDIAKINPSNLELIEDFINYYEATDHSSKSVKVTRSNLNIFFVWLMQYGRNKDFCNVKKKDILNFQAYLTKQELSPARIRALKSSLSSLSIFIEDMLEDEEEKWHGFKNIVNKIKNPTLVAVREKTVLGDEQVQEYLDDLVEQKKYQHACILALAWASGSRKAELLRFKVSYIKDENVVFGSLYKTPEKIKTKGRGQRGKPLEKYILIKKFKPYFDLWMEERRRLGIDDSVDAIFLRKRKGVYVEMQESTLDSYAKKFCKDMDVNFHFHAMRHTCCTEFLRAGLPAEVVQELFGWESVQMVQVYDDRDSSEMLGKYFNSDGIKKVEAKELNDL